MMKRSSSTPYIDKIHLNEYKSKSFSNCGIGSSYRFDRIILLHNTLKPADSETQLHNSNPKSSERYRDVFKLNNYDSQVRAQSAHVYGMQK